MPIGDRVQLPMSFDVDKMHQEVGALALPPFMEYSVTPLTMPVPRPRTAPVTNYANGAWADWPESPFLKACPYLQSVVDTFRARTRVTLVRLLRLAPGGLIEAHTDPTLGLEVEDSLIRLTIPIASDEGTTFYLNDTAVPMRPGECWYLRLTDTHRVVNEGSTVRINMSIDMIPNAWIRSLIESESVAGAS